MRLRQLLTGDVHYVYYFVHYVMLLADHFLFRILYCCVVNSDKVSYVYGDYMCYIVYLKDYDCIDYVKDSDYPVGSAS